MAKDLKKNAKPTDKFKFMICEKCDDVREVELSNYVQWTCDTC